jgi:hypothetical protein
MYFAGIPSLTLIESATFALAPVAIIDIAVYALDRFSWILD